MGKNEGESRKTSRALAPGGARRSMCTLACSGVQIRRAASSRRVKLRGLQTTTFIVYIRHNYQILALFHPEDLEDSARRHASGIGLAPAQYVPRATGTPLPPGILLVREETAILPALLSIYLQSCILMLVWPHADTGSCRRKRAAACAAQGLNHNHEHEL